jgi:hypothetical protein
LIERPAPVLAGVGGVEQEVDLAGASSGLHALGAVDEVSRARFHPEPVERGLAQRRLGAFAEVGRDLHGGGLERALESGLELALCVGGVELRTPDSDPCTAAWSAGANVGRDASVGPEREPDQLVLRALAPREDAGPFGNLTVLLRRQEPRLSFTGLGPCLRRDTLS